MSTNLEAILNMQADEITAPPSIPAGSYVATVASFKSVESSQKKTPGIEFTMKITEAKEDVDEDALAQYRADGGEVIGTEMAHTSWASEKSAFMLRDFLKDTLGISSGGRTMAAMLDEVVGKECIIKVVHQPSSDGKRVFARVTEALPL